MLPGTPLVIGCEDLAGLDEEANLAGLEREQQRANRMFAASV
jgi:hypothetical protein